MYQYKCTECQKKLNLSDVSGVKLDGWTWWSWRNFCFQFGQFWIIMAMISGILSFFKWLGIINFSF